jgi:hypothetical protein
MAQKVQRAFSRRYGTDGRAQPGLERLMRSTEQPTEADGDSYGGIRARLDGIADYVGKIAGGILRLPVEVFGGALNLFRLPLHLGLHVPCNPAEPFFNLPAEVLGGPGHAMFVHWYSPWVMSPTNDGDRRWFKRMKREWKSSFVGAPRPDQSDLLHTRSSTIFRSGAPA